MKIITVAHQKGGVGKTTLALNLAYCLKNSVRVALLDSDPQGSVSGLNELVGIEGIDVVPLDSLDSISDQYDVAIIDTPPYLSSKLPSFFEVSDFVLVPTKAGVLDVMAIKATISLLQDAKAKRPKLQSGIVLNMVKNRTTLTQDILDILQQYNTPILKTMISDRVSYARSPLTGGVFETEDTKAMDEIMELTQEILDKL